MAEYPRTRAIVRRLPPLLTLAQFLERITVYTPYITSTLFIAGKHTLKKHTTSRVYLQFSQMNITHLIDFCKSLNGAVFTEKNIEYRCVVELAPFQPKPLEIEASDDKLESTIENDSTYIEFIKNMETPSVIISEYEKQESILESNSYASTQPKTTPLLESLRGLQLMKTPKKKTPKKKTLLQRPSSSQVQIPAPKLMGGDLNGKEVVNGNDSPKKSRKKKKKAVVVAGPGMYSDKISNPKAVAVPCVISKVEKSKDVNSSVPIRLVFTKKSGEKIGKS